MSKKALGSYQKVQANTANPIQRVIMVYNGINRNLKLAIESLESEGLDRFETANNAIHLAERLIRELQLAIDKVNGGELAQQLDDLYTFWISHLSAANREKDAEKVKSVQIMVQELTEGWVGVEKQLKEEA